MSRTPKEALASQPIVASSERDSRRPYSRPRLEELGTLFELTLGPSPGVGESGNPTVFRAEGAAPLPGAD
ncbi:MAG: hypothetical protein KDD11_21670 [Acidobacteria bacterium]|nr:hypothetical protein [Acidobacteriota bacterium]